MRTLNSLSAGILFALAIGVQAQTNTNTAVTDPVGFMSINLPVGSDTVVATPLTRTPVFQGAVGALSGFAVTVSNASFGDLVSAPHYVQPIDGSQAGMLFDVLTNTADTITLANNGVSPTGLSNGVRFKVIPYWTLGTLFPSSNQGISFSPSTNQLATGRRTEILFPDVLGTGINRAPKKTFFFVTNGYWRSTVSGSTNVNNTPILPDSYFIVRNRTNVAPGLKLTIAGSVNVGKMAIQLDRIATGRNDNHVSLGRPVDITLNDLGLVSSGAFTPSSNTLALQRKDELYLFDNSVIGLNKAARTTYFYVSNSTTQGWRSTVTGTNDVGTNMIPAAVGYFVRKASNSTPTSQFWTNAINVAQ